VDEHRLPELFDAAGLVFDNVTIATGPMEQPAPRPGYDGMTFVNGQLAS
jgi:hypothetical protein